MGSSSPHFPAELGLTEAWDGQEIVRARGNVEKRWGYLLSVCIPGVTKVAWVAVHRVEVNERIE